MTFQTILEDDASEYLDTLGGESVTYQPDGGAERVINALVNRRQPAALGTAPHGHAPLLTVVVENSATTGICSSEINTGKDKIKLEVRIGLTAESRRLTKILSQDAGMMILEVR